MSIVVEKGSKDLFCSSFNVKGKIIKEKKFGKKLYDIPLLIEESIGGTKYSFKPAINFKNLKSNKVYEAGCKLIKFCSNKIWDEIIKKK